MIYVAPSTLLADPFDPNTFPDELPGDACFISLSDRWDIHAIVDRQDYEWARQFKWCHTYGSGSMVAVAWQEHGAIYAMANRDHIYARNCAGGTTTWLHREVLLRSKGRPPRAGMIGDHKNGNTLDCRRSNLRWATKSQNAKNVPNSRVRKRFLTQAGAA
ncbi:HNH endonuclease signature motif containing protein [Methylobacterium fujisawaense]